MVRKLSIACALGAIALSVLGCAPEEEKETPDDDGGKTSTAAPTGQTRPIILDDLQPTGEPIKMAPADGDEVAVL